MSVASGLLGFAVPHGYLSTNVVKNVEKVKAPQSPPPFLFHEEWEKVRGAQRVGADVKPAPGWERLRLSKLQRQKR